MTKHNLPSQPTSFVGRKEEIADISALLQEATCRLLTLCGSGGIGKTRLAIEAATRNINHFPDGIWMANLELLTTADDIVPAVVTALELELQDGRNLQQQLLDYLSSKRILLIMDNFEHLLDGVGLVTDMLEAAPGLQILATSREALKLREEWIRHIRGLDVPNNEQESDVENYSAVQLFVEGARRVQGDFSLAAMQACVVRLCQMVEGLPLALELAASWLKVMPCAMIITEMQRSLDFLESRLGNMPARHRSMSAAFDQSWHLLSAEEQAVFKKLAVFRGGFFREAVAFVTGVTLSTLSNLVDKALLRVDANGRYHLHSLLRQYAEEKLTGSTQDYITACDRHCHYYTDFLHERESAINYGDNRQAHIEVEAELDNIRRAMAWALEQRNTAQLGKAIATFTAVYFRKSLWKEGYTLFERIVALARSTRDDGVLWRALTSQGWFAHCLSDYEQAARFYEQALSIGRQSGWHGPLKYRGFLMLRLSEMAMGLGKLDKARQYMDEISTEIDQAGKPRSRTLWILETRGRIAYLAGDYQEAQKLLQEGLTIARSAHNQSGIVVISNHLAYVYLAQGAYTAAQRSFAESLAHGQEFNFGRRVTRSLVGLGLAACYLEEINAARSYFSQALETARENGNDLETLYVINGIAELLMTEGREAQALELLAYVHQHPTADWEVRVKAAQLLNRLESTLSSEMVAQAGQRAKALDLDTIIDSLLTERPTAEDKLIPPIITATPFSEHILAANQALPEPLTKRELEVLQLVASGHSNRKIADELFIGVHTVKKHITHIFGKLDVSSRTQAINRGRDLHLL